MKVIFAIATCLLLLCQVYAKPSVTLMLDDNMTIVIRDSYLKRKEGRGNRYWKQILLEHFDHVRERFHIDQIQPLTTPNQLLITFHHDKDENNDFKSEKDKLYHQELEANLAENLSALEWVLMVRPHQGKNYWGFLTTSEERLQMTAHQNTLRTYVHDDILEDPKHRKEFLREEKRQKALQKQARQEQKEDL